MVLSLEERVSSTRWLVIGFVGVVFLVLLLGFLFWGLSSFFEGENALSLIFFASFVFLSLGFAGLSKRYWSEFVNSFLNFLVNVFFPAVTQEGMFTNAILALLILGSTLLSLDSSLELTGLSFGDYFLKVGTLGVSLLILLVVPVFVAELYYIVSENKPSERFIKKAVYVNTFTMFFMAFIGGVYFFLSNENPNPLMVVGTLVFFFQGSVVFLMMIFKRKFEDRIMEFRVIYEEPPANILKVVLVVLLAGFLFSRFVLGMGVIFSAFNVVGFAILIPMLMKWKFAHTVYDKVKEKVDAGTKH